MKNRIKPQNSYGLTIEQLDRKFIDEIGRRFEEGHTCTAVGTYLFNNGIPINRYKIEKYRRTKYPHTLTGKSKKAMARNSRIKKMLSSNKLYKNNKHKQPSDDLRINETLLIQMIDFKLEQFNKEINKKIDAISKRKIWRLL